VIPLTRAIPECIRDGYDDALHKLMFLFFLLYLLTDVNQDGVRDFYLLINEHLSYLVINQLHSGDPVTFQLNNWPQLEIADAEYVNQAEISQADPQLGYMHTQTHTDWLITVLRPTRQL